MMVQRIFNVTGDKTGKQEQDTGTRAKQEAGITLRRTGTKTVERQTGIEQRRTRITQEVNKGTRGAAIQNVDFHRWRNGSGRGLRPL